MAKRFLVWNSTGLPDARKRLLEQYVKAYAVDIVILIEGGQPPSYIDKDDNTASFSHIHERYDGTSRLMLRDHDHGEQQIRTKNGNRSILSPVGGVSTLKYYAIGPADQCELQEDDDYAAYENLESDVRYWVISPMIEKLRTASSASGTVVDNDRAERNDGRQKRSRQSGVDINDEWTKVSARTNFLGHRRPKTVKIGELTVYLWHAPLGGGCSPHDLAMSALPGNASGGPDAKYHNYLFNKHMDGLAPTELLVGDLNIDAVAVTNIYGRAPQVSSADGWCHAVAGARLAVSNPVVVPHNRGLMGDHSPIIFTVDTV
jgi:hypothetical protein